MHETSGEVAVRQLRRQVPALLRFALCFESLTITRPREYSAQCDFATYSPPSGSSSWAFSCVVAARSLQSGAAWKENHHRSLRPFRSRRCLRQDDKRPMGMRLGNSVMATGAGLLAFGGRRAEPLLAPSVAHLDRLWRSRFALAQRVRWNALSSTRWVA